MLKTYRIIPLVFILFLFGFTLITVSPVFAQEQWNPSMGMCHNSRPCMKMNQCGDECAVHVRESKGWVNPNSPMPTSTSPSGGEVAELNAKVAELETQLSASNAAQEPLNARMAELEQVLNKLVADVRSFISHPLHDVVSLKYALRMALERTGL